MIQGAEEMRSIVPRIRLKIMPGEGHCVMIERAEAVGEDMLEMWHEYDETHTLSMHLSQNYGGPMV